MGGQRLSPPFSSMRPTHQCSTAGCRELTFSSWEWGDISTLNLPQFKAVRTYKLTSLFFCFLGKNFIDKIVHLRSFAENSHFFLIFLFPFYAGNCELRLDVRRLVGKVRHMPSINASGKVFTFPKGETKQPIPPDPNKPHCCNVTVILSENITSREYLPVFDISG